MTNQVLTGAVQEPTGGVAGWAIDLMERLGAAGAGLAVALENLFPPLPSEVILPLAGFAAARGDLGLVAAIAFTTLGSVVGALMLYGVGAVLGRDRTRALAEKLPLVKLRDVDKAEDWFGRHGAKAVLIGRLVPVVRSLISVPAGVERMPIVLFLSLTAAREPGLELAADPGRLPARRAVASGGVVGRGVPEARDRRRGGRRRVVRRGEDPGPAFGF